MSKYVLDASALLAFLFGEDGADRVEKLLPEAVIGAVNFAEVMAKLQEKGVSDNEADLQVAKLDLEVIDLDRALATEAGRMRASTRKFGLSLADRLCLALAAKRKAVAVTSDRIWPQAELPIEIEVVR